MKKQIPNIFTLLNLFFGCIAIVYALQTECFVINVNDDQSSSFNLPEKIVLASLFIFLAAIIDFLDGFVARLFNATSEMGKQLDSLADVVSFGVAPGVILFQLLRASYIREDDGLYTSLAYVFPAFIYSCAGAYRLAAFNIDSRQKTGFRGVPIPAAGLFVASFPLIIHSGNYPYVSEWLINKWVLYGVIIALSALMVSKLPLIALKFTNLSVKSNLPKYILILVAVIAGVFLQWLAVPAIFIAYIILSLAFKNQ